MRNLNIEDFTSVGNGSLNHCRERERKDYTSVSDTQLLSALTICNWSQINFEVVHTIFANMRHEEYIKNIN